MAELSYGLHKEFKQATPSYDDIEKTNTGNLQERNSKIEKKKMRGSF